MNEYIEKFKAWFTSCTLRERAFVCALSWAVIYAFFSLTLYRPVDATKKDLSEQLKKTNDQIESWKAQLKYLKEIPNTPLYKEWSMHRKNYETLRDKYKNLLGTPSAEKWDAIIKTVLTSYPNITIESVHNAPEMVYTAAKIQSAPESIYQHQMKLTVLSNYFDAVGYLQYLEKNLPNIHWDTLTYEVKEYPTAEVSMEFSILYDKNAL